MIYFLLSQPSPEAIDFFTYRQAVQAPLPCASGKPFKGLMLVCNFKDICITLQAILTQFPAFAASPHHTDRDMCCSALGSVNDLASTFERQTDSLSGQLSTKAS
jgi:hypothetical protein